MDSLSDDIRAAMAVDDVESDNEETEHEAIGKADDSAEAVGDEEKGAEKEELAEASSESTEAVQPPILAPAHWTKEAKATFDTLPRDVQQVIAKRELDRERGVSLKVTEVEQQRKVYEDLEREMQPNLEAWGVAGKQPAQVLRQLVAMQNFLQRDPASAIAVIARSYGLDLQNLQSQARGSGNAQAGSPEMQSLYTLVDNLQSRLSAYEQHSKQTQYQDIERDIETFADEKDTAGTPLRPYFRDVAGEIMNLLPVYTQQMPNAGHREILQTLYDRVVWANPDTRQAMLKMQEQTKLAELKRKSEQAKRASKSISGSPGQTVERTDLSLRQELARAFKDIS